MSSLNIEHNLLSTLLDYFNVNYFAIDTSGKYIAKNSTLIGIVGSSEKADIINESAWLSCKYVMETGKTQTIEELGHNNRWYLSIKKPLIIDNKIKGVVGIAIDITERKQIEDSLKIAKEKAEASDKAKTQFLENIRHDIRTPITGIVNLAELIKLESHNKKISHYANNMIASSQALLEFMNNILEIIRINSDTNSISRNKFSLKNVLQSILDLNYAKAREKKLKLTLHYDNKLPNFFIGDADKIYRIILELTTNSLNFTHKGKVQIKAELEKIKKSDNKVILKLSVGDTGIGIPTDKKEAVFEQFTRLNPAYTGNYPGLGLGLSIVKKLISELGGEIYIDSVLNKGSVFTCFIPLKQAILNDDFGICKLEPIIQNLSHRLPKAASVNVNHLDKQKSISKNNQNVSHILLIEDNKIAAETTKDMLQHLVCRVDIAENGKMGYQKAKTKKYDLIFMDVGLPDISGYEATQKIRKFESNVDRHTPILALTAHIETENKKRCINAGMDAVLAKPLSTETAIDILSAFIPSRMNLDSLKAKISSKISSRVKQPKIKKNLENDSSLNTLPLQEISGEFIDMKAAADILGKKDLAFVRKMLTMLVNSFPEELKRLKKAHEKNNWEEITAIAHKLRGGAAYCGTFRLKTACTNLEEYNHSSHIEAAQQDNLYQTMLTEIENIKQAYQRLN